MTNILPALIDSVPSDTFTPINVMSSDSEIITSPLSAVVRSRVSIEVIRMSASASWSVKPHGVSACRTFTLVTSSIDSLATTKSSSASIVLLISVIPASEER